MNKHLLKQVDGYRIYDIITFAIKGLNTVTSARKSYLVSMTVQMSESIAKSLRNNRVCC